MQEKNTSTLKMMTLELASERMFMGFVMGTVARLQSHNLPAFLTVLRLHQSIEEQTEGP